LSAAVATLGVNATSIPFGNVAVKTAVTQSVTLASTGTALVTISGATVAGAGFTLPGAKFPATLNPNQETTLNIEFDPTALGAATGQLTITSNSSTNGTAVVGLTGTGTAPPQVVAVVVSPTSVSTTAGANQQFAATVTGTSNTTVTWTVTGTGCTGVSCGTISSSGLYTAPAAIPSPSTVIITATSEADQNKSASSSVTISTTSGKTYYLATTADGGNDANSGLSRDEPWLSPNHSINCGDVIIAAPSTSYDSANFTYGHWGTVTCPGGNNVAWVQCATFDTCKVTSSRGNPGITVDNNYWGVQGWEVKITEDTYAGCFSASANYSTKLTSHHIIFANDIANGCFEGGLSASSSNSASGVDYIAFIGNIVYDAAKGNRYGCNSGVFVYQPVQYDSAPGTHIYVAGNFSWGNVDTNPCGGGIPTDGMGVSIDTPDGSQGGYSTPYTSQIVVDNNILLINGGRGFQVFNNSAGSQHAPIYVRHNTSWGNNTDTHQINPLCSEMLSNVTLNVQEFLNIAATNSATNCSGNAYYAFYMNSGDITNHVYSNVGWSEIGSYSHATSSFGFTFDNDNLFGTNPAFANAVAPGAPSCGSATSVPNCMAKVIANFTPTNPAATSYGYQIPGSGQTYDPLFPQWLCRVTLPGGLVTEGCRTTP
jgi:hypothetical protein